MMQQPALTLTKIDKRFGAVHANRAIDLTIAPGTIHGIVGENGAGKSTLVSIIFGFYEADSGTIAVHGKTVTIRSPSAAIGHGIGMVHQHFMLVEPLTVLDNIMLGAEQGLLLARGETAMRAKLAALAADYGLMIDPDAIVGDLPVGLQQRVEILKALVRDANILILDEPTAVLTPPEADQLFVLMRRLKSEGKTILLITHKLREIMAVTDNVSVMRRGEMVATVKTAETTPAGIAELMVGRHVLLRVEKAPAQPGAEILRVDHVTVKDSQGVPRLDDISFTVRAGEIVGIAGVSGNGQSELLEVLAGITRKSAGTITLDGQTLSDHELHPHTLRHRGVMHVPEDRQRRGLVTAFEESENAILGYVDDPALGAGPLLDIDQVRARAEKDMAAFDVRPPDPRLKTANFSGGNQQKIVLAREISRSPKLLLVGQPTRGVDIGAIEFIHRSLIRLRDQGCAILLVSVELDEIRALSDRILVMCGGRIMGERMPDATHERELGLLMAGVTEKAA
ncbi:MAG: ABC transporter ATP-binding protein [Beijerinckiaceae bacterium]